MQHIFYASNCKLNVELQLPSKCLKNYYYRYSKLEYRNKGLSELVVIYGPVG